MDPSDDFCWEFLDCSFWPDDNQNQDHCGNVDFPGVVSRENECTRSSPNVETDFSSGGGHVGLQENEYTRKRGRVKSCSRPGSKACREKMRRERLNERFLDLSAVLEPGRPAKTDKPAILDDAIRVLNQLRSEGQELRETNEKLLDEIKTLKAEKNELREEKLTLKADKEKMELQLKAVAIPPPAGFLPAHPAAAAAYHAGANKMAVYPSYGFVPMWQYMPPATRDTSHDHELRPPAA